MAVIKQAHRRYLTTCAKCPDWSASNSKRIHADFDSKMHQSDVHGRGVKKPIAYGWRQSKSLGGDLLLVCASCRDGGKGYVGEPMVFRLPFDEAVPCVFCKKMVK